MRKTYLTGAMGCLLILLTACSSPTHKSGEAAPAGASPAVSAPASSPVDAPSSAPSKAPSSAPSSALPAPGTPASGSTGSAPAPAKPGGGTGLVPMQSSHGGEFQSPSGNITCEINYERSGLTEAYCQTGSPARSVTMTANGSYKTCTGDQCLGNAGEGTPTLAYGKATGVGPFRCESATAGITCTANGKGFRIANSGVTSATA
jgi:hypothetical protein